MLGTDHIGTTNALNLLSSSLAPTTYANYDSGIRQFAAFCHEEGIHPLQATTQSLVRYTAWLGLQGTIAAASLQQYYSAINQFFSATTKSSG
jgi:site-specific recombinase XerD